MGTNSKVKINVSIDPKFEEAMKRLAGLGVASKAVAAGLAAGAKGVGEMAKSIKNANLVIGNVGGEALMPPVSRAQYEALSEKYARASQRVAMLLSLLGADELKRIGLLSQDSGDETDEWDRVVVLNALDKKIETFNAAHKRLTGSRKKLPDTGKLDLSPDEMKYVMNARAAGVPIDEILKTIERSRSSNGRT